LLSTYFDTRAGGRVVLNVDLIGFFGGKKNSWGLVEQVENVETLAFFTNEERSESRD
jgi:hypothetical protein